MDITLWRKNHQLDKKDLMGYVTKETKKEKCIQEKRGIHLFGVAHKISSGEGARNNKKDNIQSTEQKMYMNKLKNCDVGKTFSNTAERQNGA